MLDIISLILYCLINFIIKKVDNLDIILKYLLLKIINKKLNKKKVYLIIKINLKFKT